MDEEMQDKIDSVEYQCRIYLSNWDYSRCEVPFDTNPQDLLDIFAAFRLEIIKAGGPNA